jgi:hypothetical protein
LHSFNEGLGLRQALDKEAVVTHFTRQLTTKVKGRRSLFDPACNHRCRWRCVKSRISFHCRQLSAIEPEKLAAACSWWEEITYPTVISPNCASNSDHSFSQKLIKKPAFSLGTVRTHATIA